MKHYQRNKFWECRGEDMIYIAYFLPEAQSDDCMDVASGALFYSGSRIYPVPGVGTEFS